MPPKEKKTKAQILAAASSGGKSKKKKWSKGKQRDKLNNAVYFDKVSYDKLTNELVKSKLLTPSIVSERLKISVSLARLALRYLEDKKLIVPVGPQSHAQKIYSAASAVKVES